MNRTLFAAMPFALLLFSADLWHAPAAHAADDDELPPTTQFFEEYDANADGRVTQDEFDGAGEVFRLLDKDKDGAISGPDLGLPLNYKPDPKAVARADQRARGKAPERDGRNRKSAASRRRANMAKAVARMDADEDGKVSADEWKGRPEGFKRLDTNEDGFIDEAELKRGQRAMPSQRGGRSPQQAKKQFERLDKNGDGAIDAEEAPSPRMIELLDKDKDGRITLEELVARRGNGRRQQAGKEQARNKKKRGRKLNAGALRRFDRDGDGKVTVDEFPASPERFKAYDANGDGFLSEEDINFKKKDAPTIETAKPAQSLFAQLDKDGDGKLHRGEFTGSDDEWSKLDVNQDGWLSTSELK